MARTIAEIYNSLNVVKSSMQELHDYVTDSAIPGTIQDNAETLAITAKSGSKVAQWRLWLWIMAVASWVVETFFDKHKADIQALLAAKRPHTPRWYAEESKKYQYGYEMIWADNQYSYEVDDPTSRIIKYAAASEKQGKVILKVAKEVNGAKTPLSSVEKITFERFWDKWRDAGVKIMVVSQPADILKINITIVRDRLVLDAQNRLLRDASVYPIKNAIDNYASSLEFDGTIKLSKLIDAIQAAEGVLDVKLASAYWKPAGGNYTLVDMEVVAESGYFVMSYLESGFTFLNNVEVEILPI